jgi:dTMP kinase
MVFRLLPAFFVGPPAGALLDRVDRRRAMVVCDVLRGCIVAAVPFVGTLAPLYAASFVFGTISLVWTPAKDALVPSLVPDRWLVAANSMALFTTYAVFPLGSAIFTGLVSVGEQIGALARPENLALWIVALTSFSSASLVWAIRHPPLPKAPRSFRLRNVFEELVEGIRFLRKRGDVARIMRGTAFALAGGAVVISLGAPYVSQVLHGGAKGFGLVVSLAGAGVGLGVLLLALVGERLEKGWIFATSIVLVGLSLVAASVTRSLGAGMLAALALGTFGGTAYATGFALLQESSDDQMMGRTMASAQVVIRLSLFVSLVAFPGLARLVVSTGLARTGAEGIRLAMATGGLLSAAAGMLLCMDVFKRKLA